MRENQFQSRVIKFLERQTAFVFNIHGSEMQRAGMPDCLVHHRQWHGYLEFKVTAPIADIQRRQIKRIKQRGFPAFIMKPDGIYDEDNNYLADWTWSSLLEVLIKLSYDYSG